MLIIVSSSILIVWVDGYGYRRNYEAFPLVVMVVILVVVMILVVMVMVVVVIIIGSGGDIGSDGGNIGSDICIGWLFCAQTTSKVYQSSAILMMSKAISKSTQSIHPPIKKLTCIIAK